MIERTPAAEPAGEPEDWFARGLALEAQDADAAHRGLRATRSPPTGRASMRTSTSGGLLHDAERLAKAERVYREAIAACGNDAVLLYNLGVLLDDMERTPEAIDGIRRRRCARDPDFADCHYNLALLCEELGSRRKRSGTWRATASLRGAARNRVAVPASREAPPLQSRRRRHWTGAALSAWISATLRARP